MPNLYRKTTSFAICVLTGLVLSACSGSDTDSGNMATDSSDLATSGDLATDSSDLATDSGDLATSGGMTKLSLNLVDAPIDNAAHAIIRVKGVRLHTESGEDIAFQYCADAEPIDEVSPENEAVALVDEELPTEETAMEPVAESCTSEVRDIDLLALTDGASEELLDDVSIPAGSYSWVRLEVDEDQPGYIELSDGAIHDLTIPGGAHSGFKLNGGFSATINGSNQFVMDFDLRKSIHQAGNKFILRPTLRLIKLENPAQQRLNGEWLLSEMGNCPSPMVYVYEGVDVVADDIGGTGAQPVTTTELEANEDGSRFTYQIDYISYGDYSVAYTCAGADDAPEKDDDIEFVQTENVTVGD